MIILELKTLLCYFFLFFGSNLVLEFPCVWIVCQDLSHWREEGVDAE